MRRRLLVLLLVLAAGCGSGASLAATTGDPTTTTSSTTAPAVVLPDVTLAVANRDGTEDLYDLSGTWLVRHDPPATPPVAPVTTLDQSEPPAGATYMGAIHGHWAKRWVSPDGHTRLGYWSGECESPSAWFSTDAGPWRPVVDRGDGWPPESRAVGWAPDGRAVVSFTEGICGTGIGRPGTYLVAVDGTPELVMPRQATAIRLR